MNDRYKNRKRWRRQIDASWRVNPITACELRFSNICVGNFGLAPCHSKNGDERFTFEDEAEVVAGCVECHFYADRKMSKEDRLQLFKQIIANRDVQIESI